MYLKKCLMNKKLMKNQFSMNYTPYNRSFYLIGGKIMNDLLAKNIMDGARKLKDMNLPHSIHSSFTISTKHHIVIAPNNSRDRAAISIVAKLLSKRYPHNIRMRKIRNGFHRSDSINEFYDIDTGKYFIMLDHSTFLILSVNNTDATISEKSQYYYLQNFIFDLYGLNHNYWNMIIFNAIEKERVRNLRDKHSKVTINRVNGDSYLVDVSMDFLIFDKKENILSLMRKFINSKRIYNRFHIPYRIGILMYGKPGTGKSSFALALSKYLEMPLYLISANDIKKEFFDGSNSIILIEELDLVLKSNDTNISQNERINEELENSKIRYLINFIDSIDNGCILIATTNHIENLNERIIRSGRFDIKIEMKDFSEKQAIEYIEKYDEDPNEIFNIINYDHSGSINPSYLQSKLVQKKISDLGFQEK